MSHVSLLKDWRTAIIQEDQPLPADDVPDIEEPYNEIERILRWREVKHGRTILKEYLVLWKNYPKTSWVQDHQFSYPNQL